MVLLDAAGNPFAMCFTASIELINRVKGQQIYLMLHNHVILKAAIPYGDIMYI